MLDAVKHVLQLTGLDEHTAATKRGKAGRLLGHVGRRLFEQPIHRPPNEFAHRPVLLPGDGPQPLHDRIWKENLNLLHGSML